MSHKEWAGDAGERDVGPDRATQHMICARIPPCNLDEKDDAVRSSA